MRSRLLAAALAVVAGAVNTPFRYRTSRQTTAQTIVQEANPVNTLIGKTIRWTFVDGPVAGMTFEHELHDDGSVTWRYVDGEHSGASAREKAYAAVKVNEQTWALSYLSASGHTLTAVLDFHDHRVIAFGSNDKSWSLQHGTFELR
jgi:MoaF N-terminal domain